MIKNKVKLRYIILISLAILFMLPFLLWLLLPKNNLEIAVINKTFPTQFSASGDKKSLDYSKQRGLFWVMDHLRIQNPTTNKAYAATKDYYGNFLSEGKLKAVPFQDVTHVPDLIYISDTYGTGNSRSNGVEPKGISGLTVDEVSLIATSYAKGTTVIGEYNIAGEPTVANVSKELEAIFNVGFMGWAGKFFSDLSSTDDVPNWIRSTYEQQYGKKWTLTGAGIVIAGNNRIVILERGKDFSGQSISLFMSEDHASHYNTGTIDYYNWFEIVEPKEDKSVIAWYDLNATEAGNKQLKRLGLQSKFPAIIANQSSKKSSYYFAGDFSDYKEPAKFKGFLGASALYKMFSVKSEGDHSYFYWHFYVPLMSKLLKEIEPLDEKINFKAITEPAPNGTQLMSKISDDKFAVYRNGAWHPMFVKGVNIGTSIPGISEGSFPDDTTIYSDWLEKIGQMNANTIRVYTLMPSGFYRALDIYNTNHPDKPLYLLQNISPNMEPPLGDYLNQSYNTAYKQAVKNTINAIHGNASLSSKEEQTSDLYRNNVSGYVLGYVVDPDLSPVQVKTTNQAHSSYTYKGHYVSSKANASPTESWLAAMSDFIFEYEQQKYNMQHPAAISSIPELDIIQHPGSNPESMDDAVSIDINQIETSSKVISGYFGAYDVFPDHPGFMGDETGKSKHDYAGYKQYLNDFMKTQTTYPALIAEFGLSTSMGSTQITADGYNDGQNSEKEQGEGIVAMMNIIKDSGSMGGLIYEWADQWGKSSRFTSSLMIPYDRGSLWHNVVDPAQRYGVLAVESKTPEEYAMTLQGDDPLQSIAYAANESYFYITAEFSKLPEFSRKKIMIYLDTVDRKNGEYMLAPDVNENWSGAEFNVSILNSSDAKLLVVSDYNASKGTYFTSVSSDGIFEKMMKPISPAYKTATGETISAAYEDGSTLIPGSFEQSESHFYFEGKKLFLRIPWARLNFTDPSSLLVVDDEKTKGIVENKKDSFMVRMTDGIVASLVIMDKATEQVDYHFPESATASGYKTFTWDGWNAPQYASRNKESYNMIKQRFAEESE